MEAMSWVSIAALVAALGVAGALIYAYKRGVMKQTDLANISALIESALNMLGGLDKSDGLASLFAGYAAKAVRAVEQLVKNGELEKDDAIRKNEARSIVEQLAIMDGVGVDTVYDNEEVIGTLIEAAVNEMQSSEIEIAVADGEEPANALLTDE